MAADRTVGLLRERGHAVLYLTRDSRGLDASLQRKIRTFVSSVYSAEAHRMMMDILRDEKPDVVHCHNLFPRFSPSILAACKKARVPAVLTLHSFFLECPTTFHFRQGSCCESCVGGREYWCLLTNCRGNFAESAAYATRTAIARLTNTFQTNVQLFIALSEFARRRFIRWGIPESRITVIRNMAPLPTGQLARSDEGYAAFAGRLSPEKGCDVFVEALSENPSVSGVIAGDGPLGKLLIAESPPNATFVGWLTPEAMDRFLSGARFLVLPSRCFEMCPLSVLEAMAHGKPVIAPRLGGLPEIVEDGVTGLLFEPGNAEDLGRKMLQLWRDEELTLRLGAASRDRARTTFSGDAHYRQLLDAYQHVIALTHS